VRITRNDTESQGPRRLNQFRPLPPTMTAPLRGRSSHSLLTAKTLRNDHITQRSIRRRCARTATWRIGHISFPSDVTNLPRIPIHPDHRVGIAPRSINKKWSAALESRRQEDTFFDGRYVYYLSERLCGFLAYHLERDHQRLRLAVSTLPV
jgi:hypothetical protein